MHLPPDLLQDYAPRPHGPTGPGCAMALLQGGQVKEQVCKGMASVEHQVPITPQTVFRVASITKQFLCAGLLALSDEGALDLDAPLAEFLELREGPGQATVRQAMSNTSGIRDHIELCYLAGGGLQVPHRLTSSLDMINRQAETNFAPGSRYLYSNANFVLLTVVAEQVSGQRLEDFLSDRFFKPLGMTRTHLRGNHFDIVPDLATGYVVDHSGTLKRGRMTMELSGDGAAMSCLEDLTKWTRYYRDDPDGLIARMCQPVAVGQGHAPYGLGLFSETVHGRSTIVHTGLWPGYLTEILHFVEDDLTLITLANVNSIEPTRVNRDVVDLIFAARPKEHEGPDPAQWQAATKAGLWIAPETLDVAEFSEGKSGKMVSTYGFHVRVNCAPGARLVPEFRRSDIEHLELSEASDGRIGMRLVNGQTLSLVPAQSLGRDTDMAEMIGDWWCAEIEARLIIGGTPEHITVQTPGFRGHDWIATPLPGGVLQIEEVTGPWPRRFFLLLEKNKKELIVSGPRVRRLCYARQ